MAILLPLSQYTLKLLRLTAGVYYTCIVWYGLKKHLAFLIFKKELLIKIDLRLTSQLFDIRLSDIR